jgi:hypothetical protein
MGQFCQSCGKEVEEGESFCSSCGSAIVSLSSEEGTDDKDAILWSRKVPLISNPVLIKDLFFALLIAAVVFGSILWIITGEPGIFFLFFAVFFGLFVLFLIVALVLQLITKGGLKTEFYVGSDGAAHRAGRGTQAIDRAAIAGSIIAGSAVAAGAGLIAFSQEANSLRWEDVRHIGVHHGTRLIVLRSRYLINPVALYCTEENFEKVLEAVRRFAPKDVRMN